MTQIFRLVLRRRINLGLVLLLNDAFGERVRASRVGDKSHTARVSDVYIFYVLSLCICYQKSIFYSEDILHILMSVLLIIGFKLCIMIHESARYTV